MSPSLTREEAALDELIAVTNDRTIAVLVGRSWHPGTQIVANRLRDAAEVIRSVKAVEVDLDSYSEWSRRNRVFGTPCVLVFRDGDLVRRINGVVGDEDLHTLLRRD